MHLVRACEVAVGDLHNNKNSDYTKDIFPNRKLLLRRQFPQFNEFKEYEHYITILEFNSPNYAHFCTGYSFLLYIPASIGLKIFSCFTKNPCILFYTSRMFNLFVWLTLTYFSIKITPFKWAFFVCALFPMTVYEGMSVSADSMNLGFSFLYLALIFYFIYKKEHISTKDFIALAVITTLCIFFKGVILFSLLLLLIPPQKLENKTLKLSILLLFEILLYLFLEVQTYIPVHGGVDIAARKALILSNPEYVAGLFFNTFINKTGFFIQSSIFRLGWLQIYPTNTLIILSLIAYLMSSFLQNVKVQILDRLLTVIICVTFVTLTILFMYLTFSPLYDGVIVGTQGRYFIALYLIFAITIQNKIKVNEKIKYILEQFILVITIFNLTYAVNLIIACLH